MPHLRPTTRSRLRSWLAGLCLLAGMAAPALAQSDTRPSLTIAVQKISNSNTLETPREQSNVGFRLSALYAESLIGTDWLGSLGQVPGLAGEEPLERVRQCRWLHLGEIAEQPIRRLFTGEQGAGAGDVDAGDADAVAALAREHAATHVLNAVDPQGALFSLLSGTA